MGGGRSESRALSAGVDPDNTYHETPYEKGFCFVSYRAHLVGDQGQFDDFHKVISSRGGGPAGWGVGALGS